MHSVVCIDSVHVLCSYDPSGRSGHASTPKELDAVMHAIGSSKELYESRMAWKHRQVRPWAGEVRYGIIAGMGSGPTCC